MEKKIWTPPILGYQFLLKKARRTHILYYSEVYKKYGITLTYNPLNKEWVFVFSVFNNIVCDSVKDPKKIDHLIKCFLKKQGKNEFISYLLDR